MSRAERWAELAWDRRGATGGVLRWTLAPAAAAFSAAVRVRALAYRLRLRRGRRLPAGVVSVGNLTVGGTGKTPTALWHAEGLSARGRRVAILSRGYGGSERGPLLVGPPEARPSHLRGTDDWRRVGDETVLLARRFAGPVIVARRRFDAGELACRELGADTMVLDDGFQHLALQRDFDLVCVRSGSCADPAVLPAGRFREPLSALRRADAVLLTKGQGDTPADARLVEGYTKYPPDPLLLETSRRLAAETAPAIAWHRS